MRIKTILRLAKESLYLRRTLARYSGRLARGKYHLFDNFRSMSLADTEQIKKAAVYFGKEQGGRKGAVAKRLNQLGFYRNRNKKTTGEYTAFYSANNYDIAREVKLFSFDKKKILTICTNEKEAEKQLQEYATLNHAYPMPALRRETRYPNALEISMVEKLPFPGDVDALSAILDCTQQFSGKDCQWATAQALTEFSYENPQINALLTTLTAKIHKDMLLCQIPLCMQHGDLSKENLIYGISDGKTAFWWIDWEHGRNRMFLYDFFFYILNSAMYYDRKALDAYLAGQLDDPLHKFFAHFGLVYDPAKKIDYLLIYAVNFLKERVCNFGRVNALKDYCDLIETILRETNET